jgi:hypothetical protein
MPHLWSIFIAQVWPTAGNTIFKNAPDSVEFTVHKTAFNLLFATPKYTPYQNENKSQ